MKRTDIFINEDYCKDALEYKKELWEKSNFYEAKEK